MKILITGAAGFIGSHCAERLHTMGHTVIGVDNFSNHYSVDLKKQNAHTLKNLGIQVIEYDLNNDNLESVLPLDVDYIFHFAAQPGLSKTSSFNDYLINNVEATQNLLNYAINFNSTKLFINIGTSSVYGLDASCNESTIPQPASNYGVTKLSAEQLVLSKSRVGLLKACSLRLYSIYGSRERPDKMFTKLIDCALNNKEFPLYEGSLKHVRSFTHISDAINGIVSILDNTLKCNNEIINIGTDKEYTTLDGITAVENALNVKIKFKHLPARSGDQSKTKAVIEKATALLNYHPKMPLKEGVKEQIIWFKNHEKQ